MTDVKQENLTAKQQDYAIFLPAISGFYSTFVGKQRDPVNGPYVDPARFPQGLTDMEQMNWLNKQKAFFPYKWSLYSAGHANLDLTKQDWGEDMIRNRDPDTMILGDSGGFQIAKGLWEGDWKANSGCPKAQKKRELVLTWLDTISNYGMILDVPSWVVHDKVASKACGIRSTQDAVDATKFNNEYFMNHRRGKNNGGARFLNVLQGNHHKAADEWYETMKEYCDPQKYPDTHFDGWAMGAQNTCDAHLIMRRMVALRYDNLLQEGKHDWMHFLGIGKLELAVFLTILQRAVRKHINPSFTISFDCASPFLATANGQVYFESVFPHNDKWSYRMAAAADDKKYATDTRKWGQGIVADGILPSWQGSPIGDLLTMKDICIYKPGDLNKIGKEGRTSWDSFSYALLMGHNVYAHIYAVQEANRRYDLGEYPKPLRYSQGNYALVEDIIESIFAAPDRASAEKIIDGYSNYWMEIIGSRGFKGKKALNSFTKFDELFEFVDNGTLTDESVLDESALDKLEKEID